MVQEGLFDASVGVGNALLRCASAGGACAIAGLSATCSSFDSFVFGTLDALPPESELRSTL